MLNPERIENLQALGYSPREAAFLCLAALHSGYFLRRQYRQFAGTQRGYADDELIKKALSRKDLRARRSCNKNLIYHLYSRSFYRAIGQEDNRHRRRRSPREIKAKLMSLDFVLAHPENRFLATEQEKFNFFIGRLGVDPAVLPSRMYCSRRTQSAAARYFVDKFPIFLPSGPEWNNPRVSFCYVDPGSASIAGFATYLNQYRRLLAELPYSGVVYVSDTPRHFEAAKTRFSQLTKSHLIHLRGARKRFPGERIRSLFELWKIAGGQAVMNALESIKSARKAISAEFTPYRLRHSYALFGWSA